MKALQARPVNGLRIAALATFAAIAVAACGLGMDSGERLARGQQAYADGEYRAAAIDARTVLQAEPDNVDGRLLLGRASLQSGDAATAEKELRRAVELGATSADVKVDLGRALLARREYQQVLDEISPMLASGEGASIEVYRLLGDAELGLGNSESARQHYQQVLVENEHDLDAMLGIVSSYSTEKRFSQARATLDEVRAIDPEYIPVWLKSAGLHLAMQNAQGAETDFQRAVDLAQAQGQADSEAAAVLGLIEARLLRNDIEGAEAGMSRLRELAPDDIGTRYLSGRLAYTNGDLQTAQAELQSVLQRAPDFRPAQMLLGAVHLSRGNLEQADMYLSAVVAAAPDNTDARRLLAETRIQQNDTEAASSVLQPLLGGAQTDDRSLVLAARASLASGKFSEATEYLRKRIEADPDNATLQLDLAAAYLTAGETAAAEALLRRSGNDSTTDSYRRGMLIVMAQIRSGDYASALSGLDDMIATRPEDARLYILRGGIHLATREFESAESQFLRALELSPGDRTAIMNLARIDVATNDYAAARERFMSVLEQHPGDSSAMIALAKLAAVEQDETAMREWLEKARDADGGSVAARLLLARLHLAKKEYTDAVTVISEALKTHPGMAELYALQGVAQFGAGDTGTALDSFERAMSLDPDNAAYGLSYARAQLGSGRPQAAARTLATVETLAPTDLQTASQLALLKASAGEFESALALASQLRERFPDSEVPHIVQGEIYYGSGASEKGARAYDAALESKMALPLAIRAFTLRAQNNVANPAAPLTRFLEVHPGNVAASMTIAQYEQENGNAGEAIRRYEDVLKADPENFTVLNNLAWAYFTNGDSRAESVARRSYEQAPDNGSVVDTLGWILVKKGSLEDGVDLLRKASELSDGRAAVRYHLAAGLAAAGESAEARTILEALVAANEDFAERGEAEQLLQSL